MNKIFIGNDHTSVDLKKEIIKHFKDSYEFIDFGTDNNKSVNYAEYGIEVAKQTIKNKSIGIILCGTGIGISMAASKVVGSRVALIYNKSTAKYAKIHNNANIIAFGSREFEINQVIEMIDIFLKEKFEEGRHKERLECIELYEKKTK